MADLQKGYSFSGTSPNNNVTAEKLNAHVDSATILPGFFADKAENTAAADADFALVLEASTNTYRKIKITNLITAARGRPGATNLKMIPNASTPNSKVDVTADYVLMRRASNGNLYLAASFSGTADIGLGVAVNGLDAGVEAANTWYFIHAISDGTNDRLLISTSASSPTLPAGYVYSALLGARRNDNVSNFRRDVQHGNAVAVEWNTDAGAADVRLLNPITGATPVDFTNRAVDVNSATQTANLSQCIPDGITATVRGILGLTLTSGAVASKVRRVGVTNSQLGSLTVLTPMAGNELAILNASLVVSDGAGSPAPTLAAISAIGGFTAMMRFDIPVITNHTIFWSAMSGAGAADTLSMRITGYTLSLH